MNQNNLLTRFDPFRPTTQWEPLRGIESFFRDLPLSPLARQYERTMDMRMDVSEDDQGYVVQIDMPGVKKDAIDVSLEGNQVSVRTDVDREQSRGRGKELYSERYSGQAYRSFLLPNEIDADKARADYDGGVLTLTLPKKQGQSGRRLAIH